MDDVASFCIGWLYYIFIELIGYTVARFALPVLSLGRMYVEPLTSSSRPFNWLGYRRDQSGRIEVEGAAAGLVGLMIIIGDPADELAHHTRLTRRGKAIARLSCCRLQKTASLRTCLAAMQ